MFSPRQGELLQRLSDIVMDEMELRIAALTAVRNAGTESARTAAP